MRTRVLLAVLLGAILGVTGSQAQFRYLCFGDSITLGNFDDDYDPDKGYPGRLEFASRLNCPAANCEVINRGKSGEKTPGGLTRIDNVLENNPSHVLLLMQGTNDIWVKYDKSHPTWSYETMIFNLQEMARKAEVRGTDAVHASVIHFHQDADAAAWQFQDVEDLRNDMAAEAASKDRYFVDIYNVLCPDGNDVHGHSQTQCFDLHYPPVPEEDDRGHPNGSGYDMIADEFYDEITSVPVPGAPTTNSPKNTISTGTPTFTWTRESPSRATWYRFQLDFGAATLLDIWVKALDHCGASSCSFKPGNLADGNYSWRVRGRNPNGSGNWSGSKAFTVSTNRLFYDGFESGNTSAWSASLP